MKFPGVVMSRRKAISTSRSIVLLLSLAALVFGGLTLSADSDEAQAATNCRVIQLQQGSTGYCVSVAQQRLNLSATALRRSRLIVDGMFGPATRSFVIAFQSSRRLSADGIIGPRTWAVLYPTTAAAPVSAATGLGARISSIARVERANTTRNVERGGYNCNYYTYATGAGSSTCSNGWRSQAWCADFAKWVWRAAGANTTYLDSRAVSFYRYGVARGTWKPGYSASRARVGDAVIFNLTANRTWASHVGIVVAIYSDGRITTVSGNSGPSSNAVYAYTFRPSWTVSGYASPV